MKELIIFGCQNSKNNCFIYIFFLGGEDVFPDILNYECLSSILDPNQTIYSKSCIKCMPFQHNLISSHFFMLVNLDVVHEIIPE